MVFLPGCCYIEGGIVFAHYLLINLSRRMRIDCSTGPVLKYLHASQYESLNITLSHAIVPVHFFGRFSQLSMGRVGRRAGRVGSRFLRSTAGRVELAHIKNLLHNACTEIML